MRMKACFFSLVFVCALSLVINLGDAEGCISSVSLNQSVNGSWTSDCESTNRSGRYAKYHTFSLSSTTEVQIDLESSVDTYLFLLSGSGIDGGVVERDDDGGDGYDSQIIRTLSAGDYTIEATTYGSGRTGSFTLTLTGDGGGNVQIMDWEILWLPVYQEFTDIFGNVWWEYDVDVPVGFNITLSGNAVDVILSLQAGAPYSIIELLELFGIDEQFVQNNYPQYMVKYELIQTVLSVMPGVSVAFPNIGASWLLNAMFSNGAVLTLGPSISIVSVDLGADSPVSGPGISYSLTVSPVYNQ